MNNEVGTKLRDSVLAAYPDAGITVHKFDSGATMIDITWNRRLFVCAYSPQDAFGIDEVTENEGLSSSFRCGAASEEDAIRQLLELMASNQASKRT